MISGGKKLSEPAPLRNWTLFWDVENFGHLMILPLFLKYVHEATANTSEMHVFKQIREFKLNINFWSFQLSFGLQADHLMSSFLLLQQLQPWKTLMFKSEKKKLKFVLKFAFSSIDKCLCSESIVQTNEAWKCTTDFNAILAQPHSKPWAILCC